MPFTKGHKAYAGFKGRRHSKETRERMSITHQGKPLSEFHKLRMLGTRVGMLGKKHSVETKRMIGLTQVGKQLSQETRKKIGDSERGMKNWNWKGGITPLNRKIRNSLEYRLWREAVFKRDNWTCVFCGKVGGTMHADHIKTFALFPELRLVLDNGRTLCKECHLKTDTWGNKATKKYGSGRVHLQ